MCDTMGENLDLDRGSIWSVEWEERLVYASQTRELERGTSKFKRCLPLKEVLEGLQMNGTFDEIKKMKINMNK